MNAAPLTYQELRREIWKQAVRDAFVRGPGGALLFLWAVGVSFFWLGDLLVYASIWTAVCLAICTLAVASYLRKPRAFTAATRSLLHARFPTEPPGESRHREALRKSIEVCVEIVAKIDAVRQSSGVEGDDVDAVAQIDRLLSLQYESARQAEEFDRILALMGSAGEVLTRPREPGRAGPVSDSADRLALYQENVRATQREASEAEHLVGIVAGQLETLLLQMVRMERRTVDVVTTIETQRLSRAALEGLQQAVDARRVAKSWLLEALTPDGSGAHRTDDRARGRLYGKGGPDQSSRSPRARADEQLYSEEG